MNNITFSESIYTDVQNIRYDDYEKYLTIIDEESAKEQKECEWFNYDYRTIAPKNHDIDKPYWRIPDNMDKLKYCPYCGKEIHIME